MIADDSELLLTPWQMDAVDAVRTHGLSGGDAIDLVIMDWLSRGDTKAFADFIIAGHQPGPQVLKAVAYMMVRGDPDCDLDPVRTSDPDLAAAVPFALAVKGGKAGRRDSASKRTRDARIAAAVAREMKAGFGYDAAIATVHEWLKGIGITVSAQTVRDAYDVRSSGCGK